MRSEMAEILHKFSLDVAKADIATRRTFSVDDKEFEKMFASASAQSVDAILSLLESKLPKEKDFEYDETGFPKGTSLEDHVIFGYSQAIRDVKKQLEIG